MGGGAASSVGVGAAGSPRAAGGGGGCGSSNSNNTYYSNTKTDKLSAGDDVGIVIGLLAAGVLGAVIVSYTMHRGCSTRRSTASIYDAMQLDNVDQRDRDPDGY